METTRITYNPLTPGYFSDPHPHYAQLRSENPAHVTRFGFAILTRYHDVRAAYEHPSLSRDLSAWSDFVDWRRGSADGPLERMMANWVIMTDPPRHTALRRIHDQLFTRDLVARARGEVERIVAELLAPAVADGGLDAVGSFADRIPVYLLHAVLDLPPDHRDQFVTWSRALALTTEPQLTTKVLQAGRDAQQGMYDLLGPLVDHRRDHPGDDLLSGLAAATADGRRLDRQEVLDSALFLYQAGHPTSTQLIALGLHALLRHPDQLDKLRDNPTMLPSAVDELHRWDGPVQMNDRVATEDTEIAGVPITRGQVVRLCMAAANRDDAYCPDPDVLDIGRDGPGHLGYGHGAHHCVGAALGRVQAEVAIGALLAAAPRLSLTDARPRYLPSVSNRGLTALPVQF